jgi:hypothetical protein
LGFNFHFPLLLGPVVKDYAGLHNSLVIGEPYNGDIPIPINVGPTHSLGIGPKLRRQEQVAVHRGYRFVEKFKNSLRPPGRKQIVNTIDTATLLADPRT